MATKVIQDLPDPMQPGRLPSAAATDDMLARMADEAINQLMAEADCDEFPMRRPAADAPSTKARPIVPVAEEVIAPMPETLAAALDQRVSALKPVESLAVETPAVVAEPIGEPVVAPVGDDLPPEPAADIKALLADVKAQHEPPSLALLPLRVVNAPFSKASDRFRAIVGQLAILTLINAIAVIGYVLIFRRHH